MDASDIELLQRYARQKSDDAFAELVRRHLPLVHSAALRQVRSRHLAEEIAQTVFLDLSRNAARLSPNTVLPAWLYEVTRRASIDVIRRESRRQLREQLAAQLDTMESIDAPWPEIEPLLDEAMDTLDQTDRAAVLLRFFENKSLREVGATLGFSENAAQKRITRALERLHEFFSHRGVTITASALAITVSANGIQAAPAHLAAAIISVLSSATTATATAVTIETIAMTTTQKALIATALAAAIGVSIYESHQASTSQAELQNIRQQQTPLQTERDRLSASAASAQERIAALRTEIDQLQRAAADVQKLRAEVARLKSETRTMPASLAGADPTAFAANNWLSRVDRLRQRLAATPEANIPELRILNEEDWLAAVQAPELETDDDYRRAMAELRKNARAKFAGFAQMALNKFRKENNDAFPTDMLELRAYFENPVVDDAILQQFEIVDADRIPSVKVGGKYAITQKRAIDEKHDSRIVIGPDGWGSSTWSPLKADPKLSATQQ